jgi:leucyl-tRNA synthetase
MMPKYSPGEIEPRWQQKWAADRIYEVGEDDSRPKWYDLTMFPYTSGDLHIGHWYAMAPSDVHARFKRMQGYNVLHPMGFDAFGLPAENAAISRGIHPYTWTMQNIDNMRRQLERMGGCYDWNREVITCLPEYYRWTQWLFLRLYHAGLAYRAEAPVNWCPQCRTVLANEQVVGEGRCERCSSTVTRKEIEQWFLRITRYAEELLDSSMIEWPERINIMQRNWVGRSEGVEISFELDHPAAETQEMRVFTTRPDTIFGVTFAVMAPEHPLVDRLTAPEHRAEVEAYVAWTRHQTEIDRLSTESEKTGVFIGAYVTNRLNGERVPLWIADYVLPTYGTGAVMAVPAHDSRDFDFAKKYGLPIRVVIAPPDWGGGELQEAHVDPGTMVNSAQFDGMASGQAWHAIADFMESKGYGKRTVSYRLRDWLISRQRYWGAPIPIVYCDRCGVVPVPEEDLPVLLPPDAEFRPTGESPLKYCDAFVNRSCPRCNGPARRETDTMDTFICSSWYFLRYASPHYDQGPFDPGKVKYWLPVDQYTGGAEHAVMHLLYARFFVKAMRDVGLIDFEEPFTRLFNQGIIIAQRQKMSKSRGNVINPDEYVAEMGADVVRAYIMFIGPWEQGGEWDDSGINGINRWFNRTWNLVLQGKETSWPGHSINQEADRELRHRTHRTIKKVTGDLERFHFNTMLASLMEFTNYLSRVASERAVSAPVWQEAADSLLLLLAPTAPHMTEELWVRTGHAYSIHHQPFPVWDEGLAAEEQITLVVQVNGKVRDKVSVPASITEAEAQEIALAQTRVKAHLQGKEVTKLIYVPQKLVNVVVR